MIGGTDYHFGCGVAFAGGVLGNFFREVAVQMQVHTLVRDIAPENAQIVAIVQRVGIHRIYLGTSLPWGLHVLPDGQACHAPGFSTGEVIYSNHSWAVFSSFLSCSRLTSPFN